MNHYTRLATEITTNNTKITQYYHALGESIGLALHECQKTKPNAYLVVTNDAGSAKQLAQSMTWYAQQQYPVYLFPSWELLPYDHFSPHHDLIATRLDILYQLSTQQAYTLVTSVDTLMQKVPPKNFVHQHCLLCHMGDTIALNTLRLSLHEAGYHMVSQVMNHGEYAIRGAIIDIFPTGSKKPYRIELFDDEIVALKAFDPDTQCSDAPQQSICILPAKEYPHTPTAMKLFDEHWHDAFPHNTDSATLHSIQSGTMVAGIEQYQPLFFGDMPTLLDYLPPASTVFYDQDLYQHSDEHWKTLHHRFEQYHGDRERPVLKPRYLHQTTEQLFRQLKSHQTIVLKKDATESAPIGDEFATLPNLKIQQHSKDPLHHLKQLLKSHRALTMFGSHARAKQFISLCKHHHVPHAWYTSWEAFCADPCQLGVTVAPSTQGYLLSDHPLCLVSEQDLLSEYAQTTIGNTDQHDKPATAAINLSTFNLANLNINDAIVHMAHGVGRYQGLCVKQLGDVEHEFIKIGYADNGILYVPIHQIHLVHPYSAIAIEHPPLHHLGGKKWQKEKEKAQKTMFDTASELLETQAKRQLCQCPPMKLIAKDIEAFDHEFIHELTDDQKTCNADIQKDLSRTTPMNRLICGDVGFGKTEIAMRAALIAISNGYQVSVLAPTTVLAEQHHHTFCERFTSWELNIACLSSLRTPKQQQSIKTALQQGDIDIIIGTHSLLQATVRYHKLGLLIVDEEHRFGVRQKNLLKSHQDHTHTLMLTATPIPRTLQHAFSDLSDLSIIASAPKKRRAIKTIISPFERHTIIDAIQRELMRGGQIYFLHNRVDSLPQMYQRLKDMVPQASIEIAHGQMPKRQLDKVMTAFYQQRFSLLLCTTIIESGIDVPNANTIIINHADHLGLAQLHQLRGRVGRSHHQAFAYLLHASDKLATDASKRLDAIRHSNSLGAGFQLASHDLEIRGAGKLLGEEQSGHIETMGTALYHELLDKTVASLKEHPEQKADIWSQHNCEIKVPSSSLIPETYIRDVHSRLILYKRLAQAPSHNSIDEIEQEMIDRFGLLPEPALLYIGCARLKLLANRCRVVSIKMDGSCATLTLSSKPALKLQAIIALIQASPKHFRLRGMDTMIIKADAEKAIDNIADVYRFLDNHYQRA